MCTYGEDSIEMNSTLTAMLDVMSTRWSADPSLTMTSVGLTSAKDDWELSPMDVVRTADPMSVAVTRMGQLQYEHVPQ